MPLFMLINGFPLYPPFLKKLKKQCIYSLIKNRIYTLLIPITSYTII